MSLFAACGSLSRNAARAGSTSRIPGAVASTSVIAHHGASSTWRPVLAVLNNDFAYPQRFKGREQRKLHKLLKKHHAKYVIKGEYQPVRKESEDEAESGQTALPKPTFVTVPEAQRHLRRESGIQHKGKQRENASSAALKHRALSESIEAQEEGRDSSEIPAETAVASTSQATLNSDNDASLSTSPHEEAADEEGELPSTTKRKGRYNILMCGTDYFAYRVFHAVRMQARLAKHIHVVTPPTKMHHQGRAPALRVAPVREHAIQEGLPHTDAPVDLSTWKLPAPFDKNDEDNVLLVASFGRLIPPELMANFPKGHCLNVHPSLLPELRGSAPIPWAIMKRLRNTGVSVQTLGPTFDSGEILAQDVIPLARDTITTTLERLMYPVACKLIVDVLRDLPNLLGNARPQEGKATFAPKIEPKHHVINYETMNAGDIGARVRGLGHLKPILTYLQHGGEPGDGSITRSLKVIDMRAAEDTEVQMLENNYPQEFKELMAAPPGHARWFRWPKNVKGARADQGLIFVRTLDKSKYASPVQNYTPLWRELEDLRKMRREKKYLLREQKLRLEELDRAIRSQTYAVRDEGLAMLKECRAQHAHKPLWPKMVVSGYPAFKVPVSDFFYFRSQPHDDMKYGKRRPVMDNQQAQKISDSKPRDTQVGVEKGNDQSLEHSRATSTGEISAAS